MSKRDRILKGFESDSEGENEDSSRTSEEVDQVKIRTEGDDVDDEIEKLLSGDDKDPANNKDSANDKRDFDDDISGEVSI